MIHENDRLIFYIKEIGIIIITCLLISWLFFNSLVGMLILTPYIMISSYKLRNSYRQRLSNIILLQFKDFLSDLESSLVAGNSPLLAVIYAKENIDKMYYKNSPLGEILEEVTNRLNLNESLEAALSTLASKTKVREIEDFFEIFNVAVSSGGDLVNLTRTARNNIYQSINIKREIEEIISANRTECLIMKAMPLLIILYFRLFSSSFLTPLYYTNLGKVIMIILAVIYCVMINYSEMIVEKITA